MTAAVDRARMLTFAPMVDSETTRLVCRYYGLEIDERDHLFGWVSLLTLFHGGRGFIPLVYGNGLKLTGPGEVAAHCDAKLPAERRLFPPDEPLAGEVAADWKTYNGGMGRDVAVFSYFHLLPERALMEGIFAAPVPPLEAKLVPVVYGLLSGLFTKLLKLSPENAAGAADNMRRTFDATDQLLADGRRYLRGDRLTIGDIALCAASAPLLLPRGYGALMPAREELPPVMRALGDELRAHLTGAFVQRLYDSGFTGG
jgi:glutathione S-transferase